MRRRRRNSPQSSPSESNDAAVHWALGSWRQVRPPRLIHRQGIRSTEAANVCNHTSASPQCFSVSVKRGIIAELGHYPALLPVDPQKLLRHALRFSFTDCLQVSPEHGRSVPRYRRSTRFYLDRQTARRYGARRRMPEHDPNAGLGLYPEFVSSGFRSTPRYRPRFHPSGSQGPRRSLRRSGSRTQVPSRPGSCGSAAAT